MTKLKLKVVTLGHLPFHLDLEKVENWSSSLFQVTGKIENISFRASSDLEYWAYSDELIRKNLPSFQENILIAIANVPIDENYYARRLGNNTVVFTFHDIKQYLTQENITIENALIRAIYYACLTYKLRGDRLPGNAEEGTLAHDETRACVFDMNGFKPDIVYSSNAPSLCTECAERLRVNKFSNELINQINIELSALKKSLYFRTIEKIKKHPLFALLLSSSFAVLLGLVASYIYDKLK
jgi:hypothetical protein